MTVPRRALFLACVVAAPAAAENDYVPDPGFGTDGRTLVGSLGPVPDSATGIARDGNQYRLVGTTVSGSTSVSWARLDANGQAVLAFGNEGFFITGANAEAVIGTSLVDAQGRTLVATSNPAGVARFLATGNLDATFAGDGIWNPPDASVVYDIALGPADTLWVSKSSDIFANAEILQLSSDGVPTAYTTPDSGTFGFIPFGYGRFHPQPDGGFWWTVRAAAGTFDQVIARFTSAGTLDTGFSSDGFTRVSVPCLQGQLGRRYQSFTILPGGIAIVRGDYDAGSYLVAIYPDGTAGPARCEDTNGTIATTHEIAPRDATRFVAASFHCRADMACGALLRQYVVLPNGTIADDPLPDIDSATQVFATNDGSKPYALGNDVVVADGLPVLVGSANTSSTDAEFFAIRYYVARVFGDGFE